MCKYAFDIFRELFKKEKPKIDTFELFTDIENLLLKYMYAFTRADKINAKIILNRLVKLWNIPKV